MSNKLRMVAICIALTLFVGVIFAGVVFTGANEYGINIDSIENPDIKFIVIGDPHVRATNDNDTGAERLRSIVGTVNNMDIDFVVIMGDVTDKGTREQYQLSKSILGNLEKPYYMIIGNHDLFTSDKMFEEYYGTTERIENIKSRNTENIYQLLFVGTTADRDNSGNLTDLHWSFDFGRANKSVPTLIFAHTPIRCPSSVYISCKLHENILVYGKSMEEELNKFSDMLGVYSGHIHRDSNEVVNGARYVTVNGLISIGMAGIYAQPSDSIGYSAIKNGVLYYQLVDYKKQYVDYKEQYME